MIRASSSLTAARAAHTGGRVSFVRAQPSCASRGRRAAGVCVAAFREEEGERKPRASTPPPHRASSSLRAAAATTPMVRPSHAAAAAAAGIAAVAIAAWPDRALAALLPAAATATGAGALGTQVVRLLATGLGLAAAANLAESRAGGRAGGAAEPTLEADTHTRLDRSLGAFGLLSAAAMLPSLMPLVASVLPGAAPWLLQGQAAAGELIARPTAAALAGLLGLSQWRVAGCPSPIALVKALAREVAGTPARAPNANARLYALLGLALVAGGLGFILAPASTFAGVFGAAAAPPAAVSMMLWRVLGAVDAALAGGVAYTLKEGAAFNDLAETKFKWLNFALLATGAVHVVILAPLAQGQGGPAAPALLALWGAATLLGGVNSFA